MYRTTVRLADITISVEHNYEDFISFAEDYITKSDTADFSVGITDDDIKKERIYLEKQSKIDGVNPVNVTGGLLEETAILRKIANNLINYNIIVFHGSVMAKDGKAYLFTAKSGTGKTTHCKLWLKNIENCHILNGDKPFLLFKDEGIFVCGGPWRGKEKYGINEILPLEAVCVLERGEKNEITSLKLSEALPTVINQFHMPDGAENFTASIKLISNLSRINLYRLKCNISDEAAIVSYRGMTE